MFSNTKHVTLEYDVSGLKLSYVTSRTETRIKYWILFGEGGGGGMQCNSHQHKRHAYRWNVCKISFTHFTQQPKFPTCSFVMW